MSSPTISASSTRLPVRAHEGRPRRAHRIGRPIGMGGRMHQSTASPSPAHSCTAMPVKAGLAATRVSPAREHRSQGFPGVHSPSQSFRTISTRPTTSTTGASTHRFKLASLPGGSALPTCPMHGIPSSSTMPRDSSSRGRRRAGTLSNPWQARHRTGRPAITVTTIKARSRRRQPASTRQRERVSPASPSRARAIGSPTPSAPHR